MATALICDMCETEQADMIVTNLGNGDTLAIGENCLPAFGQTLIGELAPPEGLPAIQGDGTGWPGDVDLAGLPVIPGVDMAKIMAEAEAEARAELEAEALAAAAQTPADGSEPMGVADDKADTAEADSETPAQPETAV